MMLGLHDKAQIAARKNNFGPTVKICKQISGWSFSFPNFNAVNSFLHWSSQNLNALRTAKM